MKTLIVNTGSDSHKYAIYSEGAELARLHLEKEGEGFVANITVGSNKEKEAIFGGDYALPIVYVLKHLADHKIISDNKEISSVGVRVVAPGDYFSTHNVIDDEYLSKIKEASDGAPLHIGPIVDEIEQIKKFLPSAKIFGVSDSVFHKDLPEVARRYAIPEADSTGVGIYRYGYHGISVASILYKAEKWLGSIPEKVIICHLGSGSSITALKNGRSVDTSMGYTPLEGLPMGSRVGNIDPGAVIALGQKKNLNFSDLEKYFNTECGLLALSGTTKDIRELIELDKSGDEKAKLALDSFAYNIKKYIGAYMAALGGLDLLVFTATVGERSSIMRERICSGLEGIGLALDKNKNEETISQDGFIHDEKKSAKIAVITTDEMGEIAREIAKFL
jgi:acetate kinase